VLALPITLCIRVSATLAWQSHGVAGLPSQGSGDTDAQRDREGEQDSLAEPWPRALGLANFQVGWVESNHLDKFFDRQRASGNLGLCGAQHGTYPYL